MLRISKNLGGPRIAAREAIHAAVSGMEEPILEAFRLANAMAMALEGSTRMPIEQSDAHEALEWLAMLLQEATKKCRVMDETMKLAVAGTWDDLYDEAAREGRSIPDFLRKSAS